MLSLRTTQSIHNPRRSPQLPNRHDSPEAPQPARARHINQPAIPNHSPTTPGKPNDPNPIFGHSAPPSRTSSNSIQFLPRNPHNTKLEPQGLSVSASKRPSTSHPLNLGEPNDPSPIFGHSPTPPQAKSAAQSPLPPPLPLTSSPPKPVQLRAISKSPRLRVEDPLPVRYPTYSLPKPQAPPSFPPSRPPFELYFPCKLSILGRFGCFG
jgi:hypothetical protein